MANLPPAPAGRQRVTHRYGARVTGAWDWAESLRQRHFGEPLLERYRLEPVTEDEYWNVLVPDWRPHWPPEVYFDFARLRDREQREQVERLARARGAADLVERWRVLDRVGRQVALFSGRQTGPSEFLMTHAQVVPEARGRGIYSAIVRLMLAYTRELGFETVTSEHSPTNNAVLVPKLRAGFFITGLVLQAAWGPSVRLTYFHDPRQRAAFAFRAGDASLTPELIDAGFAGMDTLRRQFGR